YIMASRAKGTPEKNVIYGHALKTASPSIISNTMRTFLLTLPALIVTEAIFGWPGIGFLYYRATSVYTDIPVILGLTFFNAVIYISIWLLSDLFTGFLDPRIKLSNNR
ncbi:MAG: ABC transporter permease subunit, partial [Thermoplasmatota archaeon]